MKKNIQQKIFDWFLTRLSKTCAKHYEPLEYSEKEQRYLPGERKCKGCPFEYEKEEGYGCYVMHFVREHSTVPAYWFNKR